MKEATRRPWEIYDFGGEVKDYPKTIIVAPTGESICEISGGWPQCTLAENEANASLIVRAVNNHDALVAALEALEPYLSTEAQMLDSASLNEGRAGGFDMASVKARSALSNVRAAPAAARSVLSDAPKGER